MKRFVLDKEEKELLKAVEEGEFVSVKNLSQEKRKTVRMANNTLKAMKKTKNINIRMTEDDLSKIKSKAAVEGIPYQTLVSSVLHKFVNQV